MRRQLTGFLITGIAATSVQYLTLGFGVDVIGWPAFVASGIGYFFGALVSYILNYFITFGSDRPHRQAIVRFGFMVAVGWVITFLLMGLLVDFLNYNKWISQVIVTCVVLAWNFSLSSIWVFTRQEQ